MHKSRGRHRKPRKRSAWKITATGSALAVLLAANGLAGAAITDPVQAAHLAEIAWDGAR